MLDISTSIWLVRSVISGPLPLIVFMFLAPMKGETMWPFRGIAA